MKFRILIAATVLALSAGASQSATTPAKPMAKGVKFGRPPKLNPHQRREAIERLKAGETQADIARTYGVDATTIGRLECSAPC